MTALLLTVAVLVFAAGVWLIATSRTAARRRELTRFRRALDDFEADG